MAGQRVINLLEKRETLMGIESIPELKVGSEKINYMIVKAKEEVNDAVKILFAKDSKFNQLKSFKKEQIVARESQKFFVIEEPKI
jgi:GTP-binding protein EngB required for normal cell division